MDEIEIMGIRYRKKKPYSASDGSNGHSCSFMLNGTCPKCTCDNCRNGYVIYQNVENLVDIKPRECTCTDVARNRMRLKKSGLQSQLDRYTFKTYQADTPWRISLKETAENYCKNDADSFSFFVSGISGCGKSHICSAIANELMRQGKQLLYFRWVEDSVHLKQLLKDGDAGAYEKEIAKYKEIPYLYIDDFFKIAPTDADIRLAMEMINSRYVSGLPVIISTERNMNYITAVHSDDGMAIARRISEMCKWGDYCIQLEGKDKVYRPKQLQSA